MLVKDETVGLTEKMREIMTITGKFNMQKMLISTIV